MTRVGAIDCGTNSIRLLVADVDPGAGPGPATLVDVVRRMEIVRLGHGVDRTGEIAPEAMARTLSMAGDYAAQCEKLEVERVRFVATSASRDARNAAETDWMQIVEWYDELLRLTDSPVVRLNRAVAVGEADGPQAGLAWATFAAAWAVLYVGTVVTGSGPHAGDADTERNGLSPLQMSQLHADLVFLLLGLAAGLWAAFVAVQARAAARATAVLLGVSLSQGLIGFVQYWTDLPVLLVGLHLVGACLVLVTAVQAVLALGDRGPLGTVPESAPAARELTPA